jgi:hypothetical protein
VFTAHPMGRRRKRKRQRPPGRPLGYVSEADVITRFDISRDEIRGFSSGTHPEIRSRTIGATRFYRWADCVEVAERLDRGCISDDNLDAR